MSIAAKCPGKGIPCHRTMISGNSIRDLGRRKDPVQSAGNLAPDPESQPDACEPQQAYGPYPDNVRQMTSKAPEGTGQDVVIRPAMNPANKPKAAPAMKESRFQLRSEVLINTQVHQVRSFRYQRRFYTGVFWVGK